MLRFCAIHFAEPLDVISLYLTAPVRDRLSSACVHACSVVSECWHPTNCSPPGSPVHGDSPGKNTEVGCHALLQGIFPTQGLDPSLPHWSILYHLSPRGSPFHSIVTCYKVIHFSFVYFWVCLVFVATHRLSLAVLRRLRIAMAPLVAEHRL